MTKVINIILLFLFFPICFLFKLSPKVSHILCDVRLTSDKPFKCVQSPLITLITSNSNLWIHILLSGSPQILSESHHVLNIFTIFVKSSKSSITCSTNLLTLIFNLRALIGLVRDKGAFLPSLVVNGVL